MTTTYCVFRGTMLAKMYDERYMHEYDGSTDFLEEFPTKEEAVAYADAYELEGPEVFRTKYGLDSVSYEQVEVCKCILGDDNCQEDVETVYCRSSLTDEYEEAMRKHELSYWAYLDHDSNNYMSLEDML